MDKTSSTIDKKWLLCAFASFIGCFILTLYLNNHQNSLGLLSFPNIPFTVQSSDSFEPSAFDEKEKPTKKTDESIVTKNEKPPSVFVGKEKPANTDASLVAKNEEPPSVFFKKEKPMKTDSSLVGKNEEPPYVFFGKEKPTKTDASLVAKNEEPSSVFVGKEKPTKTDASLVAKNEEPSSVFIGKEKPMKTDASVVAKNEESSSIFVGKEKPMKTDASLVAKNEEPSFVFVGKEKPTKTDSSVVVAKDKERPKSNNTGNCNVFDGRWIYKPAENPPYDKSQCPFLSEQVSCQRNGRPDFDYERWSWEAKDCEIPRFDGRELLERLRGKRMVIVGDSLNRNQWESLACLLYSVVSPSRAHVEVRSGVYKVFIAKDYNCSVEFHWSPFLVQQFTIKPNDTKVLRLDKLETSVQQWRGADIMVFNTGHWWVQTGKFRKWDLLQYRGKLVKEMDIESAFEIGMKTWAHWIDQNVESNKTRVFFRSISPEHKGNDWCPNVTQPTMDESYKQKFPKPVTDIVEKIIGGMRTPVTYLNITKLSEYRRDAHPTEYAKKNGEMMIGKEGKKQKAHPDCSHWCLPGVPDTWNRIFYALLVFNTPTKST